MTSFNHFKLKFSTSCKQLKPDRHQFAVDDCSRRFEKARLFTNSKSSGLQM